MINYLDSFFDITHGWILGCQNQRYHKVYVFVMPLLVNFLRLFYVCRLNKKGQLALGERCILPNSGGKLQVWAVIFCDLEETRKSKFYDESRLRMFG